VKNNALYIYIYKVCPSVCDLISAAKQFFGGLQWNSVFTFLTQVLQQDRLTEGHIYWAREQMSAHNFHILWPIFVKFSTDDFCIMPFSNCELHENRRWESHTLLHHVNFCPSFPHSMTVLDEIRYKRSACNAVKLFSVSWNSIQARLYIPYKGTVQYSCSCTVTPYVILTIKNALVQSVHSVTVHNVSIPTPIALPALRNDRSFFPPGSPHCTLPANEHQQHKQAPIVDLLRQQNPEG